MAEKHDSPPQVLSHERVFHGPLFDVERTRIRFADGHEAHRDTIRHPGAVGMVAVDRDGRIWFVEQYRHAAGERMLEIPAGTLEPDESPLATAERELQEEVGRRPGHVEPLGGFYVAPGYTSEYIHLYLCTDLSEATLDGDDDEDITVVQLSLDEAMAAIGAGRIADAKTMVGLYRYRERTQALHANNQ